MLKPVELVRGGIALGDRRLSDVIVAGALRRFRLELLSNPGGIDDPRVSNSRSVILIWSYVSSTTHFGQDGLQVGVPALSIEATEGFCRRIHATMGIIVRDKFMRLD